MTVNNREKIAAGIVLWMLLMLTPLYIRMIKDKDPDNNAKDIEVEFIFKGMTNYPSGLEEPETNDVPDAEVALESYDGDQLVSSTNLVVSFLPEDIQYWKIDTIHINEKNFLTNTIKIICSSDERTNIFYMVKKDGAIIVVTEGEE